MDMGQLYRVPQGAASARGMRFRRVPAQRRRRRHRAGEHPL